MRRPDLQRRLLRVPGLGWLARRRAERLFDLLAGFTYSQTLAAFVHLGAPEALSGGPHKLGELATTLGLSEPATERLLDAAVALELAAQTRDGRYRLGALGLPLLGRPELAVLIAHSALLYEDLRDPVRLLRDDRASATTLSEFWGYARARDPAAVPAAAAAAYSQVMTASQPLVGAVVLDAWPLARYRQLLDVGGGEGAFLRAAAASAPALQLALLELPAVADRAAAAFDAAGLGARLTIHRGNFLTDPLPTGADCISLIRVCFDHDDGAVLRLLQQVHVALPPGGTVLIAEPMAGLPGAKRVGVYFSLYLLAMRSGRPRTPAEFARLLRTAGFGTVRSVPTAAPIQTGLMVAFK